MEKFIRQEKPPSGTWNALTGGEELILPPSPGIPADGWHWTTSSIPSHLAACSRHLGARTQVMRFQRDGVCFLFWTDTRWDQTAQLYVCVLAGAPTFHSHPSPRRGRRPSSNSGRLCRSVRKQIGSDCSSFTGAPRQYFTSDSCFQDKLTPCVFSSAWNAHILR